MQLTAKQWIELIADPEIREKALDCLYSIHNPYKSEINQLYGCFKHALMESFDWDITLQGSEYWAKIHANPPDLLPFPNKEREQAEAVLKEYIDRVIGYSSQYSAYDLKNIATDFLNQKYPS